MICSILKRNERNAFLWDTNSEKNHIINHFVKNIWGNDGFILRTLRFVLEAWIKHIVCQKISCHWSFFFSKVYWSIPTSMVRSILRSLDLLLIWYFLIAWNSSSDSLIQKYLEINVVHNGQSRVAIYVAISFLCLMARSRCMIHVTLQQYFVWHYPIIKTLVWRTYNSRLTRTLHQIF